MSTNSNETVQILTPTARDGALAVETLASAGIQGRACESIDDLCLQMDRGCGTVVISEEALTTEAIQKLEAILARQDAWSDLPIILLTSADVVKATQVFSKSGNIALLERPFSRLTLIRSVEVALRARHKQYQVRELMDILARSKDEAERANIAKSQFLANMSHEIRTPIGAIIGFIDLVKNMNSDSQERQKYLGIINRNSHQLLRLIDDILDLSKVEAGKMSIERLPFNLRDLLDDLASIVGFKAAEKGIRFAIKFKTPIPQTIVADHTRLRQILSNVINNAIKFTEKGSITLTVEFDFPNLHFRVQDTGIGLSQEQIGKLFQPFAQADSSTTRKFGGTGLGLVLSRKLAEVMGGTLTLESSAPGQGSSFLISISPEFSDAVSEKVAAPTPPSFSMTEPLQGLRILLVEDSLDNQLLISTYLRLSGADVYVEGNGADGVKAALNNPFDLVLMDVQMPVMDGHEATQKLRSMNYKKPIIALTAHAMHEERHRCVISGFSDYLTKPIHVPSLIELILRHTIVPANISLTNNTVAPLEI